MGKVWSQGPKVLGQHLSPPPKPQDFSMGNYPSAAGYSRKERGSHHTPPNTPSRSFCRERANLALRYSVDDVTHDREQHIGRL